MPRGTLTVVAPERHQDDAIQVEVTLPVRQRRGEGCKTPSHQTRNTSSCPRIPRITRLLALAIKFQDMVTSGEVRDYADLARLGYVTRARLTQIMNLLLLAPDIQEHLLSPDLRILQMRERVVRRLCGHVAWTTQRYHWEDLLSAASGSTPERQ